MKHNAEEILFLNGFSVFFLRQITKNNKIVFVLFCIVVFVFLAQLESLNIILDCWLAVSVSEVTSV